MCSSDTGLRAQNMVTILGLLIIIIGVGWGWGGGCRSIS